MQDKKKHKILNEKYKKLDKLRSDLYIQLKSPLRNLSEIDDEDDGYNYSGFTIWQKDLQAELPFLIKSSIDFKIIFYDLIVNKLSKKCYNVNIPKGVAIQTKLGI